MGVALPLMEDAAGVLAMHEIATAHPVDRELRLGEADLTQALGLRGEDTLTVVRRNLVVYSRAQLLEPPMMAPAPARSSRHRGQQSRRRRPGRSPACPLSTSARLMMGPYDVKVTRDLGADFVHAETPDGDVSRHTPPVLSPGLGTASLMLNGNKRSAITSMDWRFGTPSASATRCRTHVAPASRPVPTVGRSVARGLGLSEGQVDALVAVGVFAVPADQESKEDKECTQ